MFSLLLVRRSLPCSLVRRNRFLAPTVVRALVLTAGLSVALPAAHAAAADNRADIAWKLGEPTVWQIDQTVRIAQKAPSTRWATYWRFNDASASRGAQLGLQVDESMGETAVFSVWDADMASGPACAPVADDGGSGMSCRLPFAFEAGRDYRLRTWRLNADDAGQWWGGWLIDLMTGVETYVGSIRVPGPSTGARDVVDVAEYFGADASAPSSVATFARPQGNRAGEGDYEVSGTLPTAWAHPMQDREADTVDLALGGVSTDGDCAGCETNELEPTPGDAPEAAGSAEELCAGCEPTPGQLEPGPAGAREAKPTARVRCVVPRLTGRRLSRVRALLRTRNCTLGRVRRARSHLRSGIVVRQTRRAGTRATAGTRVGITLSRSVR